MIGGACCFTGHRDVPETEREGLERLLDKYINEISRCATTRFICGGAMGFDAMAARAVIRAREACPDIRLILALPYRGMELRWPEAEKREFEEILAQADSVHYLADEYDRDCMLRRDRYMVEHSDRCICYMTRYTGGTAYTVSQALKKGIEVINLDVEL